MSILATLRQDRAGEWKTLDEYLRELRHRETSALAALAGALAAPTHEHRELAGHGDAGATLLEVASDLRVPKGARLAAARCLVEARIEPPFVGHLFIGAGDLVTDPRLGGPARKLVESGLPAALELGGEAASLTLAAGAFARAAHAAASVVGVARVKELLSAAPELHAGAAAALFSLGEAELSEGQRTGWKRLLEQTCAAHRRAPAAARRVGLAPQWPPNLPEAFAPMIREAEEASASVRSADAVKTEAVAPKRDPEAAAARPAPAAIEPTRTAGGKTLAPPIRRSPFRRPTGTVVEVPSAPPPKPMEPLASRAAGPGAGLVRRIDRPEEPATTRGPLPIAPLPSREPDLQFDARGRRVPRADRWSDDAFEWESPILPSPDLPPPPKAHTPAGPFASRLQALLDDRPEAVDRLCAAVEARAAVSGDEQMLRELQDELASACWRDRKLAGAQAERLRSVMQDSAHPHAGRAGLRLVHDFFVSGRV